MVDIALEHLEKLNVSVPRYTSYPPANRWHEMNCDAYEASLTALLIDDPLSIYVHIPFCHSMCLYCGCSVVLNRDPQKELRYVEALLAEIGLVGEHLRKRRLLNQLHFGGGTPTKLPSSSLEIIFNHIRQYFIFDPHAEISIEIDPRTVSENGFQKLIDLKNMGFTRVSLGVQDTNQAVQEAVKRRQSLELTKETFFRARELGFEGINIDLIYGLPLQTRASFRDTIQTIAQEMAPDRISLFSYAKVPWAKPHQKAIPDYQLPILQEKLLMYIDARKMLLESGYTAIGMDHFAKESDPLAKRFHAKSVRRNFQGYTVSDARSMIGFGMSAISDLPEGYFQNSKSLGLYYSSIEGAKRCATDRGVVVSQEETLRRYIIQELMCHFSLDIQKIEMKWSISFFDLFSRSIELLSWFIEHGYADITKDRLFILVTPKGELFIRNIASCFDSSYQYEGKIDQKYSKAI